MVWMEPVWRLHLKISKMTDASAALGAATCWGFSIIDIGKPFEMIVLGPQNGALGRCRGEDQAVGHGQLLLHAEQCRAKGDVLGKIDNPTLLH